jgi:hypothetical protein
MTTQELVSYVPNKDSVYSWFFFQYQDFDPVTTRVQLPTASNMSDLPLGLAV